METDISTSRLRLIRLTDTTEGSQHVRWFHENWSDPDATAWSLHGPTHSLAESRAWMITHLTEYDNWFYAVFETPTHTPGSPTSEPLPNDGLGPIIGSVTLRIQSAHNGQPTVPPFPPPSPSSLPLLFRLLGYGFFASAWGKGYATEANAAMIDAYTRYAREKPEFLHYLEAGVDEGNPRSLNVLRKLDLKKVGWKTEEEPVFLSGEWRYGGYWIYGKYLGL